MAQNLQNSPYFIAEIGQNHDGNIVTAGTLIKMAKNCGFNAVKFQIRDLDNEFTENAKNRKYRTDDGYVKYIEHRKQLELSIDELETCYFFAKRLGLDFGITICDVNSFETVKNSKIKPDFIKIASRDMFNVPLLDHILLNWNGKLIVSTGFATKDDINLLLDDIIDEETMNRTTIMVCTSEYVCSYEHANLGRILRLKHKLHKRRLPTKVGYSDHTGKPAIVTFAICLGAEVIEMHITYQDHNLERYSDHAVSFDKIQCKNIIEAATYTKEIVGNYVYERIRPSYLDNSWFKLVKFLILKRDVLKSEKIASIDFEDKCCECVYYDKSEYVTYFDLIRFSHNTVKYNAELIYNQDLKKGTIMLKRYVGELLCH